MSCNRWRFTLHATLPLSDEERTKSTTTLGARVPALLSRGMIVTRYLLTERLSHSILFAEYLHHKNFVPAIERKIGSRI
jgi:hypothetical protein